jgi:hypothetical protein
MNLRERERLPDDVRHAMNRLKSLHEGDLGIIEVTACGTRAIPGLRALLFARERSGLYHARRRAVAVLVALGAYDELMDFLTAHREAGDAVERLGDEAVINAAALAWRICARSASFSCCWPLPDAGFCPVSSERLVHSAVRRRCLI